MNGNKVLVCGDLHTKYHIFEYVKSLACKFDKVIFLGDYVDDWNAPPEASQNLINALIEWKKTEPNKVVLLWGNHDLSEYVPNTFRCAGYNQRTSALVSGIFEKNKKLFQIAYAWNGILFTHAGLTENFAKQIGVDDLEYKLTPIIADELNSLMGNSENLTRLAQSGQARGGISVPSPIWADKMELIEDYCSNLRQVVGHTPVEQVSKFEVGDTSLVFCDTFSTMPNGKPIGDGSLLGIEYKDDSIDYRIIETTEHKLYTVDFA